MKKIKTKYTLRKDGLIVLTEVINGKKKYFYGHSDEECEQKRDAYKGELNHLAIHGRLFESLADEWWEQYEPKLSPNSVNTYKGSKIRAVEAFGKMGIKDITPRDIFLYLGEYAAHSFSQKVISRHKSVLKSIFDYAFLLGEVDSNPCAGIPDVKGKAKIMREPASDDDVAILERVKNKSNFGRFMYFCLYTGCRRGEAAALQQKNIDRKNNTASIVQSVAFTPDGKPILKSPKSASGIRQVVVPDRVLKVLPLGDPESFVFFPDGLPGQHELERGLKRFQDENGIQCTVHQLRHKYASMLFSDETIKMKDSQILLGHSSEQLTSDIYTHLETKHAEELTKKVVKAMDGRKVTKKVVKNQQT